MLLEFIPLDDLLFIHTHQTHNVGCDGMYLEKHKDKVWNKFRNSDIFYYSHNEQKFNIKIRRLQKYHLNLWCYIFCRTLDFTSLLLQILSKEPEKKMEKVVEESYEVTLKPWHGWISSTAVRVLITFSLFSSIFLSVVHAIIWTLHAIFFFCKSIFFFH